MFANSEGSEEILRGEKYFGEENLYSAVGEKFVSELKKRGISDD